MLKRRADANTTDQMRKTKAAAARPDRDIERRRKALKRALQDAELTPAEVARMADIPTPNSLYNFFAGRTAGLSAETYRKLARVIPGATVASLQGLEDASPEIGRTILVRTEARAGHIRPSFDLPLSEQTETPVPINHAMRAAGAFGVRVDAPGAELLFPAGTLLVVMPPHEAAYSIVHGKKVVLQRITPKGVEITIREVQIKDGKAWLCQRSTNPEWNNALEMPWPADGTKTWKKGDDRFSLAGVVVAAYIADI